MRAVSLIRGTEWLARPVYIDIVGDKVVKVSYGDDDIKDLCLSKLESSLVDQIENWESRGE